MARDRKRSKQRRARTRSAGLARGPAAGATPPARPAEIDERDVVEQPAVGAAPDFDEPVLPPVDLDDADDVDGLPVDEDLAASVPAVAGPAAPARVQARQGLASRAVSFLRASWAELQRVQWPDRRQVAQATAVVLGFVVIAGAFLGLADFVAQKIVDAVL